MFSLDDLNNRKALFDYGHCEIGNISVDIEMKHLRKGKLKMSASQSLYFTTYFSILIGDLIPRHMDKVWCFYVIFLRLLDLLLQNTLAPSDIAIIAELVDKNNELYLSIFNTYLKPVKQKKCITNTSKDTSIKHAIVVICRCSFV